MKVLIIHTAYQFSGGEDTVVASEMTLLIANGVEADLLQFSNSGNTIGKLMALPYNFFSYAKTINKLRSFKPDVVHIHNLHFGGSPAVIYALKHCRFPFVVTLHNYRMLCPSATLYANEKMFTDSVEKAFSWKAVIQGVYQGSTLLTFWVSCSMLLHQKLGTYKLAATYIALGEHTKQIFAKSKLRSIVGRMVVKPNFCYNESAFNPSYGDYYLYIGRLSEEKGVKTLLTAFAGSGLPLKIAGTGRLKEEVLAACKMSANINFLGQVDKNSIDTLLDGAKALIFPSKWNETFGMVIIEAFRKGVPVIVSDLGQPREMVSDRLNGMHFKSGDTADLIRAVFAFETMPADERLTMRKNAFAAYQQNYSPERNVVLLKEIYSKAIHDHSKQTRRFPILQASLKWLGLASLIFLAGCNQQAIRHLNYQKYHQQKYLADSLRFNQITFLKNTK